MDEQRERPEHDSGPDPLYSPLHEGQLSLMPDAESRTRDYRPDEDDDTWSTILPSVDAGAKSERTHDGAESEAAPIGGDGQDVDRSVVDGAVTDDSALTDDGAYVADAPEDSVATIEEEAPAVDDVSADEVGAALDQADDEQAENAPANAEQIDLQPHEDSQDESEVPLWPGIRVPASNASTYDLPALERPRPARDRLVPRWVYIALASVVGALALIAAGVFWYLSAAQVAVPDVTGQQLSSARARLEKAGFDVQVTDRRFSPAPRDEVLDQDPGAGTELRRGQVVRLVVSAGTEEIVMPDVVGDGLATARAELEGRGLVIIVDAVPSDVPSDTVLGSTPAAGAIVRTGDQVRLSVAAPVGGTNGLSPYVLQGLGVVIDPAPTGVAADTTMEVARRLRSLLEASGATVTTLRSATETSASDITRAQAASTATGTIAIGLSVAPSGPAGRHVSIPVTGTPDVMQRSQLLSSAITSQLVGVAAPVTSSTSSTETVLQSTRLPWARIVLGSTAAREDQTRFADPAWADQMARAIYNALGQLYGVRE